jgi:uncharacterized membrane protein YdbT with pleckstrin-like domain
MGYVQQTLLKDEEVVFETWYHWIIYFWPAVLLIAAPFTMGWTLILAIPWWIVSWLDRSTSEFAITNKRAIIKVGWIRRQTIEIHLSKVESVDVVQGVLGRIFGWGTITVIGTGGSA